MRKLLDRGADPEWVPPNGYSVLEHVTWRCWNGDVVDLVASRVKPRQGFWISAGLGDVEAVRRYIREDGSLTDEPRQVRPDVTASGPCLYLGQENLFIGLLSQAGLTVGILADASVEPEPTTISRSGPE